MPQNQNPGDRAAQEAVERAMEVARRVQQVQAQVQAEAKAQAQAPAADPTGLHRLREELHNQLQVLENQREEVAGQLTNPMLGGPSRVGLTERIKVLDARISIVDAQLSEVNSAIIRAGGLPTTEIGSPFRGATEEEVGAVVGGLFIICVLLPISIAFARRIWRRSSAAVAALPQDIADRLARLDRNLDAVALEVERIGEGQRFLTRAFADQQRGLGAGQAERVEVPERDKDWQRRGS